MEGGGKTAVSTGKSILVSSVQELTKNCLTEVPEKYVRFDQDIPVISAAKEEGKNSNDDNLQVPIINLEALISGDEVELGKMHSACQEWGFFQLINHGVSSSLVDEFKTETKEFFHLPLQEKQKYWQTPTEMQGFGQAFVVSEEQKLDWADMFYLYTLPKYMRKPHLFPMLPLPYRDTLENYSSELQNLAIKLLDCMSKALKIDREILRGVFGDEGLQSFRMNYYPPCPQPDKVIGFKPHSDAVFLTILLQHDDVVGLQILKDGKWAPIKPLSDAFVVNVGDILEIATNGMYRSILHRAIVNATKERISTAAFHMPALDAEIGPIPELIKPGTPAQFRRISVPEYYKGYFSRDIDGKSYLDAMRINGSST